MLLKFIWDNQSNRIFAVCLLLHTSKLLAWADLARQNSLKQTNIIGESNAKVSLAWLILQLIISKMSFRSAKNMAKTIYFLFVYR